MDVEPLVAAEPHARHQPRSAGLVELFLSRKPGLAKPPPISRLAVVGSQVNFYTYGVDDAVEVLLHEALVLGHGARIPDHHRQLEERQQCSRSELST